MRRSRSSLISVQWVIFGRGSGTGKRRCARSKAVSTMSMATSPLAWQLIWMSARVGTREEALRPLEGREHYVDGDIAVGVAIDLDVGAVDALDPGIELVLLEDEIAFV